MSGRTWMEGKTITDLWWFFNEGKAHLQALHSHQLAAVQNGAGRDRYQRNIEWETNDLRLIAAELRHRGERVEWGE